MKITEMVGKNMLTKFRSLLLGLLLVGTFGSSFGQIKLVIGDLTVDPADVSSGACIQVPIMINDPDINGRLLKDITFTVEISGDTGVINGLISDSFLVANAFGAGATFTGIRNPGVDLTNVNAEPTPSCSLIFNQATQGSGPTIDFEAGNANATWFINNNGGGVGRKSGFVINFGGQTIGTTVMNSNQLVGILEIPINAAPPPSQLVVTATPNAMVTDANIYTYDDGTRVDGNGDRVNITEDFDLSMAVGTINIVAPINCAPGDVTITDNYGGTPGALNWRDVVADVDNNGGDITLTIDHSANVEEIRIATAGGDIIVPATGTQTVVNLNTEDDAFPSAAVTTNNFQVFFRFDFMGMTVESDTPCSESVTWAAAAADLTGPVPQIIGNSFTFDITLTNARSAAGVFGTLTPPSGPAINLTSPTNINAETNVLTFQHTIPMLANSDAGTWTLNTAGPGVGNTASDTFIISFNCPTGTTASAANPVTIGGSVLVTFSSTDQLGWRVEYPIGNVVFTTNDPMVTSFNVTNITAANNMVRVCATGFGGSPPGACEDCVDVTLVYANPTCMASQSPDSTVTPVDVGTVITLTLTTTGADSATLEGVPMTPVSGTPGTTDMVVWEATHVAVTDTTLQATATNPDGVETTCDFVIDINCIDPEIVSVARVGQIGITISGTPDCDYTVRIINHNTGSSNDYTVTVGANGLGSLEVVVPPDAWIEVGQLGIPVVTDSVMTVPILGNWGFAAFVLLLVGIGVFFIRKRRLAAS
jgi:hypothetical protein